MSSTAGLKILNKSFIQETFENNIPRTKVIFKPNEYLFHQDANVTGLYLITSGIVKIIKCISPNKESILSLLKSGDFIGQQFIVGSNEYSHSAKAIGNVEAYFYSKDDVLSLLNTDQALRIQVILLMCDDVEHKETKIADKAFKNLKQLVADTLMLLFDEYGHKRMSILDIGITLNDFASLAGISITYLRKVLLTFEQNDLIEILNKKSVSDAPLRIKIINKSGLRHLEYDQF